MNTEIHNLCIFIYVSKQLFFHHLIYFIFFFFVAIAALLTVRNFSLSCERAFPLFLMELIWKSSVYISRWQKMTHIKLTNWEVACIFCSLGNTDSEIIWLQRCHVFSSQFCKAGNLSCLVITAEELESEIIFFLCLFSSVSLTLLY